MPLATVSNLCFHYGLIRTNNPYMEGNSGCAGFLFIISSFIFEAFKVSSSRDLCIDCNKEAPLLLDTSYEILLSCLPKQHSSYVILSHHHEVPDLSDKFCVVESKRHILIFSSFIFLSFHHLSLFPLSLLHHNQCKSLESFQMLLYYIGIFFP